MYVGRPARGETVPTATMEEDIGLLIDHPNPKERNKKRVPAKPQGYIPIEFSDDKDASDREDLKRNNQILGGMIVALLTLQATVLSIGFGVEQLTDNPVYANHAYQHAAVAADAAVCSQVGVDILKKNGSAVDAAIASLFCVGVVNLHSTGIGGGGFMVYYNATSGKSTFIDYTAVAPLNLDVEMLDTTLRGT